MPTDEETKADVSMLKKVILGDPLDPDMPGVIADQRRMSAEQARTNEILTELRNAVLRINWMLVSGFVLALFGLVFKTFYGAS